MELRLEAHVEELLVRHPELEAINDDIVRAYLLMEHAYACGAHSW